MTSYNGYKIEKSLFQHGTMNNDVKLWRYVRLHLIMGLYNLGKFKAMKGQNMNKWYQDLKRVQELRQALEQYKGALDGDLAESIEALWASSEAGAIMLELQEIVELSGEFGAQLDAVDSAYGLWSEIPEAANELVI